MIKFKKYFPNKNFYLTANHVVYIPLFTFLFILIINDSFLKNENIASFFTFLIVINLVVIIVFVIICHFLQQKNHGSFIGHVEFYEDKVINDLQEIDINAIERIDFSIGPRYGQYRDGFRASDIRPRKSNGNANVFYITLKDKSTISGIFHLGASDDFFKQMRELLIVYHLKGKIPFLTLLEYLGIHDYQKIQVFKREIYSKKI